MSVTESVVENAALAWLGGLGCAVPHGPDIAVGEPASGAQARVIDFDDPNANEWLAVNQFTVAEGQHTRRPDVVVFVNGLPLAPGGHPLRSRIDLTSIGPAGTMCSAGFSRSTHG